MNLLAGSLSVLIHLNFQIREIFWEVIPELLQKYPLAFNNAIHFQQDSAPKNSTAVGRAFLTITFLNAGLVHIDR